jgi:hypothetical protein
MDVVELLWLLCGLLHRLLILLLQRKWLMALPMRYFP